MQLWASLRSRSSLKRAASSLQYAASSQENQTERFEPQVCAAVDRAPLGSEGLNFS
jgi:hypothetical protein